MQTPAGYTVQALPLPARAYMTDFWQVVFTPSFLPRILHVWVASWTAGCGAGAQRQRLVPAEEARMSKLAKSMLQSGAAGLRCFAPSSMCSSFGAQQAIEVTNYQPLKLASMEGLWQTQSCAPMYHCGLGQ